MKDTPQYRVLLVEADGEYWKWVQAWLQAAQEFDLDMVWAGSYADAKRYLTRQKPDVIVSGCRPGTDRTGLDLANWLWARGDGIPLILFGGDEMQGSIDLENLGAVVTERGLSHQALV